MKAIRMACFAAMQITLMLILMMLVLSYFQRRFIYPLGYSERQMPAVPLGFAASRVPTPSGRLLVWSSRGDDDRPALVFLHGNAMPMSATAKMTQSYRKAGWSVIVPEYPGYPGNDGTPSEEGLIDAARAGWKIAERLGHDASSIVVLGNSIGSGPAVALAAERHPMGTVIVSGMSSLPEVIRTRLPLVPDFLVWDRYPNASLMPKVKGRVMVIHGASDRVIPIWQGERLASAAGTRIVTVAGGHEIIADAAVQRLIIHNYQPELLQ